ncbi:MAG: leucine-rich repeat protein [Clostridia bacterium]|nr:leucine-rich repeat protein [Clostridia bacterium]
MKATKVLSLLLTAAMLLAVLPLGVWAEGTSSNSKSEKSYSLIPAEDYIWTKKDVHDSTVEINYYTDGSATFTDTGSSFPSAEAVYYDKMIAANIEEDSLSIDFSIENGTAHIFIYLLAADGYSSYVYTLSNSALGATDYMESLGDLYAGVYKLDMKLTDFVASTRLDDGSAFPQEAIVNGQLRFVGLQIYVCNGATLTIRDLSIVTSKAGPSKDDSSNEDDSDEPPEGEEEPTLPPADASDYTYEILDSEVTITWYMGEGGDVVIPSEIEGYPVTGIGDYAFSKNELITSVVIPYGVKYIGVDAFMDCWNLQSVVIPDSVVSIGTTAFSYCESLTAITIPASVATIGESAFYRCNNMDAIYCLAAESSDGWAEYWDNGFYGNIYLDGKLHKGIVGDWRVTIDRGETTIVNYSGDDANVVIPSEIEGYPVTTIGWGAFERMDLVSVTFPDTVRTISKEVFYLTNVETVWIPASVEYVGSSLAYGCDVDMQIYCEAESQPERWDNNWATDVYYDKPLTVHWGDFAEEPDVPTDSDNLALGKDYIISQQFRQGGADVWWGWDENAPISYPDEGGTLTDGIRASFDTDYLDPIWAAFNVNCPEYIDLGYSYITVDLGEICSVSEILLEFYNPKELGIATPYQGNFYISKNGVDMEWIGGFDCIPENDPDDVSTIWYINETSVEARYIHVCFKMNSWAFLSEIEVYGKKEQPPVTLGDVTGDGKINSADVSHLMRYFADLDYATGTSTVEIGDNADCNGDGVLDGRDVVRLLRYLANRDPLTGESDVELGK